MRLRRKLTSGAKAPINSLQSMCGLKPVPSLKRVSSIGKRFLFVCQAVLVAAVVCFSLGATDPTARLNDLGHKMMCTCGCGQVLLECNHVGCTYSGREIDELKNALANGQDDTAILQGFVQRWGTTVLAAPTMQGFDLVAWIMPFAVSAMALVGTILLVRNWSKKQAEEQMALTAVAGAGVMHTRAEDEMQERIRRETGTD
jgi:cytochrome c-type biogenesis protein CcmH